MQYIDTSAFLKLLVAEAESAELRAGIEEADLWSSTLLDLETHRVARRLGIERNRVTEALETVTLVFPAETTFATARHVGPDSLRALDALHLAALELGSDLEAVISYDARLAAGCEAAEISIRAPGRPPGW